MKRCKVCNRRIWNPWSEGFDLLDLFYKTPNHIFDYTAKDVCWYCGCVTYTELEKLSYKHKGKPEKAEELENISYYNMKPRGIMDSIISYRMFDRLMESKKLIKERYNIWSD